MAAPRSGHLRKYLCLPRRQFPEPGHQRVPHSRRRTRGRRGHRRRARRTGHAALARWPPHLHHGAHYRRFRQPACSYQSQQAPAITACRRIVSGGKQDRVMARTASFPSARLRFLLMSSVSNTGVGPAARNLRLQKLSSIPAFAKERPSIKNKRGLGRSSRRHHSQSGPAAPPPQISTRSIQGAIAGNGRTEAYEKIYESQAVGFPSTIS